jgi:Protein of unknown function (DUF4254)
MTLRAVDISAQHDALFLHPAWPQSAPQLPAQRDVRDWIQVNHQCNAQLWDEEDLARRKKASDAEIAANKRAIDRYNQARNDAVERMDEHLLLSLGLIEPASAHTDSPLAKIGPHARLNSETAGAMIDKLSILALKIKAMQVQTLRTDVDAAHRDIALKKHAQLLIQRLDLGHCLDQLLADCAAGRAYFKIYRQFKMYNDARLNPALVAEAKQ